MAPHPVLRLEVPADQPREKGVVIQRINALHESDPPTRAELWWGLAVVFVVVAIVLFSIRSRRRTHRPGRPGPTLRT